MFNKSIVVALILCACYLGTIQAGTVPLNSALLTGLHGVETVDQTVQSLSGGGGGGVVTGLTGKVPVLSGGSGSGLPILN